MYARFFRWASDRLDENGIVAFVTNRSFIDSRTFDGFRKVVAEEFSEIYVVDLGGDVRANPQAVRHEAQRLRHPDRRGDQLPGQEARPTGLPDLLRAPSGNGNGATRSSSSCGRRSSPKSSSRRSTPTNAQLAQPHENDWNQLIPVATKKRRAEQKPSQEKAIFKLFSLGVVTNRDEWVYDLTEDYRATR